MQHLPWPRLLDHLNAADGPSEAEEKEKDAKRQRSTSTTPRSTSGTLRHEYDMVMGIAPFEPQESERFEGGTDSDFQDAEETATRETDAGDRTHTETRGPGKSPMGKSMGDSAVPHYESEREFCNSALLPLLPSTLGKV